MSQLRSLIFAAFPALILMATSPAAVAGEHEAEVLAEINFARTRPQAYAQRLRHEVAYGRADAYSDPRDLAEAVDFLMRQSPLPPLARDRRLEAAARDHAERQGASGEEGHGPPGALGRRLRGEGLFAGLTAENISYGPLDAREVVAQLIIDSGVPSRGHRHNIFGRGYQAAGVACVEHRRYGGMCVIDFAGAMVAR